ncbi:MAG: hypothetical protein IJN66_00375 [Muribaculaceae bacterium]|nr:hypothetical protein [Muribaculaceae bacterium]
MKTIMQYIVILLTSLSCFALFSCHDENDIFSNEIGSTLEHFDGKRVSTFYLPHDSTTISNGTNSATVYLENTETLKQYEFSAKTILKDNRLEVKMDIPNNEKIDDGIYNLSVVVITNLDIILMRIRFIVKIRKEMIDIIDAKIPEYKYLSGSGTNKNPYLISSTKDFDYLLYNLKYVDTELHGKGSYFSQTANFDAPKAGDDADGREYASFPFAGIYKGNGHTISNINYTGTKSSSIDTNIGLFDGLHDGAKISNLKLDVSFKGVHSYSGALAGYSNGNVTLDSISVIGDIDDCHEVCGGLIGINQPTNGTLTITNCNLDVDITADGTHIGGIIGASHSNTIIKDSKIGGDVSGKTSVGGVIGSSIQASYEIANLSNIDSHFAISGTTSVGGIFGNFSAPNFKVEKISLQHTVTSADNEIKIISGEESIGGVFGDLNISNMTADSYLKDVHIKCPVTGSENVGGLIGKLSVISEKTITINNCKIASIIKGETNTGGFIGLGLTACPITFEEESSIKTSDGIAEVLGGNYTGGVFGKFEPSGKTIIFENTSKIYCGVNVSGTTNVGGFAGCVNFNNSKSENERTINLNGFELKNTVEIKGGANIGGLIGFVKNAIIKGQNTFDYNEGNGLTIPKFSRFTPNFSGKIIAANPSSGSCFGGAIGKAYNSSIKGICVNSIIELTNLDSIGGIVGHIESTLQSSKIIEDCTYKGELIGNKNIGGIVGIKTKNGQILDCINYGIISAKENVGGVLGKLCYENINDGGIFVNYCVNTGAVTGSGADTGGIVGYMQGDNDINLYVSISHSGNYGKITGGDTGVGGILGRCNTRRGRVLNCANHGEVYSANECRIGGIVGSMGKDPSAAHQSTNLQVGYCANTGTVSSNNGSSHVGGILGFQEEGCSDWTDEDSWVHDCYNTGSITGSGDRGGIVGYVDHYSYVQKCFNSGETNKGICGTRKSSAIIYDDYTFYTKGSDSGDWLGDKKISDEDAKKEGTFQNEEQTEGFDFNGIWKMGSNHPILRDCPFQDISFSN